MKTFAQYLTEAEQHQYRPSVGDTVGFEINQELLIETTVAEVLADGIVLSLDGQSMYLFELYHQFRYPKMSMQTHN